MNSPSAIGTATHKLTQGLQGSPLAGLITGSALYASSSSITTGADAAPASNALKASNGGHKVESAGAQNPAEPHSQNKTEHVVAAATHDIPEAASNISSASTGEARLKH